MSLTLPGNGIKITLTGEDAGVDALLARIKKRADEVDQVIQKVDRDTVKAAQGAAGVGNEAEKGRGKVASFFQQFLGANLAMSALSKVQQGISGMFGTIQQATNFQTQSMALAGDVGTNIGVSFKEANQAVLDIQRQISKEAAALPGVTKNYTDVFNALGSSVAKVFPHDLPKFREAVQDITKRTGMLAAVKHVDATEAGMGINRAISGTTGFGELRQLDIFQKNPQLMQAMQAELGKMGKDTKDWQKLTDQTRLSIIRKSLKVATPDSLIAEFDGTVESLWQGIQTKLFDPLTGLTGFMREIPSLNNTTVMDAIKELLGGLTKVWASAEKVAAKMGISFDPLEPLVRVITLLSDFEYMVLGVLDNLGKPLNLDKLFDMSYIAQGIAGWFNNAMGGIFRILDNVGTLDYVAFLGQVTTVLPRFLTTLINAISWDKLGFVLGDYLGKFTWAFFLNLPKNLVTVAGLFASLLTGTIRLFFGLITGLLYGLVIKPAIEAFKTATDPLTQFFNWIGEGIKWLWDRVRPVIETAGRMFNLPGQAVQTVTSAVTSVVNDPLGTAMKAGQGVLNFITGKDKDTATKPGQTAIDATKKGEVSATGTKLPGMMTPATGLPKPATAGDKKVSMLPSLLSSPDDSSALPLPSAPSTSTVASATFAPVINMPVTTTPLDQDSLLQQLGSVLEKQYQQFKSGRLAHGIA